MAQNSKRARVPTQSASAPAPRPKPRQRQVAAATPAPAKGSAGPNQIDTDDDRPVNPLRVIFRSTPSWLVSMVFHLVLLLVLAVVTIVHQNDDKGVELVIGPAEEVQEVHEISEIDFEQIDQLEVQETSFTTAEFDPGQISFGDLSAPAQTVGETISEVSFNHSNVGEIRALFGKDGNGMVDVSGGLKGAASFFGSKAAGNRVAFVVDNSNSMGKGKFETALVELAKSVRQLGPRQQFYVVFYSDTAYPLFYPKSARRMVFATDQNKQKFEAWLKTLQLCLRTKGEQAMKQALSLQPDLVFLLGDGAFTDKTAEIMVGRPVPNVVIHTLGMQVKEKDAAEFAAIAKAHKGTYRDVGVTPQGLAMFKRDGARPRNRTRKGIWGIELPLTEKKK